MPSDQLPPEAIKKATNIVRDARLAIAVSLIPLLGFVFILRLVQWYLLKNQYPALLVTKGENAALAKQFRSAISSLWLAVLMWPVLFLIIYLYPLFT